MLSPCPSPNPCPKSWSCPCPCPKSQKSCVLVRVCFGHGLGQELVCEVASVSVHLCNESLHIESFYFRLLSVVNGNELIRNVFWLEILRLGWWKQPSATELILKYFLKIFRLASVVTVSTTTECNRNRKSTTEGYSSVAFLGCWTPLVNALENERSFELLFTAI